MKYFNQNFNCILYNFPLGMQLYDSITLYYYTTTFPTKISSFIKRVANETLARNFPEAITVEKYLHAIRVIIDDYESKDSKETGRKSHPSSSNTKYEDSSNIEILIKTIKALSN